MASSPPLLQLLSSFETTAPGTLEAPLRGHIGPSWLQGATTFGGCSAALCLLGARRVFDESEQLPLRSVLVDWVGAAGGDVHVESSVVRRGKSSAVVRADLVGAKGIATTATFTFAKSRASALGERRFVPPPPNDLPLPDESPPFHEALGMQPPHFFQNFEVRLARRGQLHASGDEAANWLWIRHAAANDDGSVVGVVPDVALLCLADVPPPAILSLLPTGTLETFPNVSSLTWQVNLLDGGTSIVAHPGGWWLIVQRIEHLHEGFSSCDMALWGRERHGPALVSRQAIAVYA